jgi:hypothetical protein
MLHVNERSEPVNQPATQHESVDEEQRKEQLRRNEAVLALLNAWEHDDPEDQRETWAVLEKALDEDPITFRSAHP